MSNELNIESFKTNINNVDWPSLNQKFIDVMRAANQLITKQRCLIEGLLQEIESTEDDLK